MTLDTKGQFISKWFFGIVDFLQKTNENKERRIHSFVFFEEIDDPKNLFEIN